MTGNEMILEFKVKSDKLDTQSSPDLFPETILILLNNAMDRLVNTKYSGNNIHRLGFEEWQKRTDDLKALVKRGYIQGEAYQDNAIFFDLKNVYPTVGLEDATNEYLYFLRGSVQMIVGENKRFVSPKLVQQDDIEEALEDIFNKPSVNNPLMIFENGGIVVYLPTGSTADLFRLTYLKRPKRIVKNEECELDVHVHSEIVDLAITLALETIESQRIQTQPALSQTKE